MFCTYPFLEWEFKIFISLAKYLEVELLPWENNPVFTFYFKSHLQEYFERVARIVQRAPVRPGERFLTRTTIFKGTSLAFGLKNPQELMFLGAEFGSLIQLTNLVSLV